MKREEFEKRRTMLKSSNNPLYHDLNDEKMSKKKAGEARKKEWSRHSVTNDVSCPFSFSLL